MPFLSKGSRIDQRFQIQAKLGRGGICEVYLAENLAGKSTTTPHAWCALKCLKPKFTRHTALFSALIWENELLHALRHPSIVRSQGFYISQLPTREEFAYVVLDYVEGKGLDYLLKQHHSIGFPLDLVRILVSQLGSALQYLHDRSLVHGDLKPSNLLVGGDFELKLIDFGLACLLSDSEQSVDDSTKSTSVVGKNRVDFRAGLTPSYVSPERLQGKALSRQDDVFAFACVVYELICGHRPWKNATPSQAKQRNLSMVPLPILNRRQWRVLSQGLALDAANRPDSVDELLDLFG